MIEIVWDESLKPEKETISIEKWDQWFAATRDEETMRIWKTVKSEYHENGLFTDTVQVIAWANIIELNRLERIQKETPPEIGGVSQTDRG
jgi:hypothetical protein